MTNKELIKSVLQKNNGLFPWQINDILRTRHDKWMSESTLTREMRRIDGVKSVRDTVKTKQFRYWL